MRLKELLSDYHTKLVNDEYRYHIQMIFIPFALSIVATVMTIMNIITHKPALMISTLCFAVVSFVIALLAYLSKKTLLLCKTLFIIEVIVLFTYFLITGGTAGFSPYWICMLPCCAMLALNKKLGSIWCAIMFIIIIVLLWTPVGKDIVVWEGNPPSNEFKMRFPVVYLAYYAIGVFLEHVRDVTNKKLIGLSNAYRDQSLKDELTGLKNQVWLGEYEKNVYTRLDTLETFAVVFIDVDDFKHFNEKYGHLFGNKVLQEVSNQLLKTDKAHAVRWGGDEFVLIFENVFRKEIYSICEDLRKRVEELTFEDNPEAKVTISLGIYLKIVDNKFNFLDVVKKADESTANAKHGGKNQICYVVDTE